MKTILKLNEEQQGLKLIQVNKGFVVVENKLPNFKDYYLGYPDKHIYKWLIKPEKYNDHLPYCNIILFATSNLNLEGVPVIENNEFFTFSKQQLRFLFDTSLHAKIGELNQDEEFERVLVFLDKQVQQNLFTEEQVREACLMYARWIVGGTPSLRIAQNPNERFEQIFESLKQPKVEITFEENQCDGCKAGYSIENGIHKVDYPSGSMVCQKTKYNKPVKCKIL